MTQYQWFVIERGPTDWSATCPNPPKGSNYEAGPCASEGALREEIASCEARWDLPLNANPNGDLSPAEKAEKDATSRADMAANLLSNLTDEQITAAVNTAKDKRLIQQRFLNRQQLDT
jgi:hypothetical protein